MPNTKNLPNYLKTGFVAIVMICLVQSHAYSQKIDTQEKVDSLTSLITDAKNESKIKLYLELFKLYSPTQLDKAYSVAKQAEILSTSLHDSIGLMNSLHSIGEVYHYKGKIDSVKIISERLLPICIKLDNKEKIASCYNNLASYQERIANLDSALVLSHKAMSISPEKNKTSIYNNMGRIYYQQGNLNKSIELYELGMNLAKEQGNINAQAVLANNIGGIYKYLKLYDKAESYFQKSYKLKLEIGDKRGQLFSLSNITDLYYIIDKDFDTPASKGLEIAKEIKDERFIAVFSELKARTLKEEGKLDESLEMALSQYELLKDKPSFEFGPLMFGIAEIYIAKEDYENAEKIALDLLARNTEMQSVEGMQVGRSLLCSIYENTNQKEKYFNYATKYYDTKDSLDQLLNVDRIAFMESALDQEKNEKIELLNESVIQKTKSRNLLAFGALLTTLLLGYILYTRSKLIKSQQTIIDQEHERLKLLEEKNEVLNENAAIRDRIYTNITHEFKTPLTVINGTIELMEKDEIWQQNNTDQLKSQSEILKRNSNNLLNLVDRILDLAKLDAKLIHIKNVNQDIIEYIKYLAESFHSLYVQKNISFEFDTEVESIITEYSPDIIRHLITNLISNAVKFTNQNGNISLKLKKEMKNSQPILSIEIADNGIGIASEDLDKIFDRYYQVDQPNATSRGTGIGLSLCKELVDMLDGQITVSSTLGQGSKFTIKLPIISAADKTSLDILPSVVENKIEALTQNVTKPLVLIIEDNEEVSAFIATCLHQEYECVIASDGDAGLTQANDIMPDLIITDISMPIKDGYQVAAQLKENELTSHIPIIMLTGIVSQESKLTGLEKGIDAYMVKPFDTAELLIRVKNLIHSRAQLRKTFSASTGLRTKPNGISPVDKVFFDKVYQIVEDNLSNEQLGVEYLANQMNLSQTHLNRKLKALTDLPASKFILTVRLKHAMSLIEEGKHNVSEIAFDTGFNSVSYFVKCFKEQYGETPGTFQKN